MPSVYTSDAQDILSSLRWFGKAAASSQPQKPEPFALPELSHYCDLHALISILKNNQLWGSNIRFLNDKEEMEYGIGVAKDLMKEILERQFPGSSESSKKRRTWSIPNIPDVYAVCFCLSPDLLSQWRGYGAAQQSVSIQFDGIKLATLGLMNAFLLKKVVYGADEAMSMLRKEFDRIHDQAQNQVQQIVENKTIDTSAEQTQVILRLSPQFKNEHFREENEWRLISLGEDLKADYRPRDNVLLPYMKIGYPEETPLPITGITVGPGKDSALTQKSIQHFLKSTTLYKNVKVEVSKIPFRV